MNCFDSMSKALQFCYHCLFDDDEERLNTRLGNEAIVYKGKTMKVIIPE